MFKRTVFNDDPEMFRDSVRRFGAEEITPHHAQWEKDGRVSREAWKKAGANGLRLDLHGLTLNVTKFIESQKHEQKYGIEHIAIDTDDMPALVANLKASGAKILEETTVGNGRKVCFFEGPDGVHLEFLEVVD